MKAVLRKISSLIIVLAAASITSCQLYQPDMQQGNDVNQEQVDKLKPNLTKTQVQAIMGTPVLIPMVDTNRWDYYYSFIPLKDKSLETVHRSLTLYFKNDQLQAYSGDWNIKNLPKR